MVKQNKIINCTTAYTFASNETSEIRNWCQNLNTLFDLNVPN
jgi:hypothetical protein